MWTRFGTPFSKRSSCFKGHGIQRLVGLCPDELAQVTHYGGPTFDQRSDLSLKQKVCIGIQIAKSCDGVHAAGFSLNDIKENNVCVSMTSAEPVVTIIDFGKALVNGTTMALPCQREEGVHYAPEIC